VPEDRDIHELSDLIYRDPESHSWQTADAYLSGDVRAKLSEAERAGPEFTRNADALREVQPEDVVPGDIDANLGAPWILVCHVESFAAELFGVPTSAIGIGHLKKDAAWSIDIDYQVERSVAATSDFGTARANGTWLFELALNLKTPVIYDTIQTSDGETRVVNQDETLAAREKQKLLRERFRS
jgi:N12 class adenine-specific DNA methylase